MYDRDVKAENKEQLDRLVQAIERLAEIHAKDRKGEDNSNKELLDWLKKNNERTVKEVPASDDRAEVLKTVRRTNAAGGEEQGLDWQSVNRLNNVFKALNGDFGAFQRTLQTATSNINRSESVIRKFQTFGTDEQGPMTLKRAKSVVLDELLTKLGSKEGMSEYFNRYSPKASDIEKDRQWMPYDEALANQKKKKNEQLVEDAKKIESLKPKKTPEQEQKSYKELTKEELIKVAQVAATISAPVVAMKMLNYASDQQIGEMRSKYGNFSPSLAAEANRLDLNNMIREMRSAPLVSQTAKELIWSKDALNETMKPFENTWDNTKNRILSGLNFLAAAALYIPSKIVSFFNGEEEKAVEEAKIIEKIKKDDMAGLEKMNPMAFAGLPPEHMAKLPEAIKQRTFDAITAASAVGNLAIQIRDMPICPPRQFVP